MAIHELERLCAGGQYAAALERARTQQHGALECFFLGLVAYGQSDLESALWLTDRAAQLSPGDLVFPAAAAYLEAVRRDGKRAVYVQPDAFAAFIRAGSNRRLYEAASAKLREAHARYERACVLDIGVGDGMALLPALSKHVQRVILVEPSAPMLAKTVEGLRARAVRCEAVHATIQQYAEQTLALDCDLAQATFSLQSLPPAERIQLWPWLKANAGRVLIIEFDVPLFAGMYAADRVAHVLERYRQGLREYEGDALVVQGFLMPVMFGYFDPTAARTNYEQPKADWIAELMAGGFTSVRAEPIYDYWWAPAYAFEAR